MKPAVDFLHADETHNIGSSGCHVELGADGLLPQGMPLHRWHNCAIDDFEHSLFLRPRPVDAIRPELAAERVGTDGEIQ